jgi:hypothetical protein
LRGWDGAAAAAAAAAADEDDDDPAPAPALEPAFEADGAEADEEEEAEAAADTAADPTASSRQYSIWPFLKPRAASLGASASGDAYCGGEGDGARECACESGRCSCARAVRARGRSLPRNTGGGR